MSRINDIWLRKPAGMVLGLDFSGERTTSPTGHSGTLVGNAAVAAGTRYLALDGSGDYIQFADAPEFSFTNGSGADQPFSVCAWVYHTTVGAAYQTLAAKANEWDIKVANGGFGLQIALFSGGGGSVYIGRGYGTSSATGQWIQYAFTYTGSEAATGCKIFKDTVQVDNSSISAGSYAGMSNTAAAVRAGSGINGRVADFRIYNRALTQPEITQIFNMGQARISQGGTP